MRDTIITFRSHTTAELDLYIQLKTPIGVWNGGDRVDAGTLVAYWRPADIWADGTYVVESPSGLRRYSGVYCCGPA